MHPLVIVHFAHTLPHFVDFGHGWAVDLYAVSFQLPAVLSLFVAQVVYVAPYLAFAVHNSAECPLLVAAFHEFGDNFPISHHYSGGHGSAAFCLCFQYQFELLPM